MLFGIRSRFVDDVLGVPLGLPHRGVVCLPGLAEPLFSAGTVLELLSNRVLAVRHHLSNRWYGVPPYDEHDDREPDELPEENRS